MAPATSGNWRRYPMRMVLLAGDESTWLMTRRVWPSTCSKSKNDQRLRPIILYVAVRRLTSAYIVCSQLWARMRIDHRDSIVNCLTCRLAISVLNVTITTYLAVVDISCSSKITGLLIWYRWQKGRQWRSVPRLPPLSRTLCSSEFLRRFCALASMSIVRKLGRKVVLHKGTPNDNLGFEGLRDSQHNAAPRFCPFVHALIIQVRF